MCSYQIASLRLEGKLFQPYFGVIVIAAVAEGVVGADGVAAGIFVPLTVLLLLFPSGV